MKLTKKVRRLALRSSLASRANSGEIVVLKSLEFEQPKTRAFADVLKNIDAYNKKTLLVLEKSDEAVVKSARNIPGVRITLADMVTTYDVVWAEKIVLTQGAIARMEEVFS